MSVQKGNMKKYQVYFSEEEAKVLDEAIKDSTMKASTFIRYNIINMLRQRGYFGKQTDRP